MSKEHYSSGTKTRPIFGEDVNDCYNLRQSVVASREDESAERKMQHEILNRTLRAVDGVMRVSKNPRLVWAVLVGTWLDQKTATEIAREKCAPEMTVRDILIRICKALKSTVS